MSINVLWVEDEPDSLRYERKLAEQQGWNITSADTVSRAMTLINDTAFDLVVVDLILPLDDFHKQQGYVTPDTGIQFIDAVREPTRKGSTPANVPLLVLTAVISPEQKAKVTKKLISDQYYLTKPLQENAYRRVLTELIQKLNPSTRNL
jgi:CheY-like chemotaxis protein